MAIMSTVFRHTKLDFSILIQYIVRIFLTSISNYNLNNIFLILLFYCSYNLHYILECIDFCHGLKMTMEPPTSVTENQVLNEMRNELKSGNYHTAYQILKRNPMLHTNNEDMTLFLNNLDDIVSTEENNKMINNNNNPMFNPNGGLGNNERMQKVVDVSNFLYRRFQRSNILKGFGSVDNRSYPETSTEISPMKLEEITGLPITSLTPKQRNTYWRLGGILLFVFEYILGNQIGVDPLLTFIPGTFFLLGVDQLFYKGAYFEVSTFYFYYIIFFSSIYIFIHMCIPSFLNLFLFICVHISIIFINIRQYIKRYFQNIRKKLYVTKQDIS